MHVAMLAPIAWRTPPRTYGPWELVTSMLTEALVERGIDVTLFATLDSITAGNARWRRASSVWGRCIDRREGLGIPPPGPPLRTGRPVRSDSQSGGLPCPRLRPPDRHADRDDDPRLLVRAHPADVCGIPGRGPLRRHQRRRSSSRPALRCDDSSRHSDRRFSVRIRAGSDDLLFFGRIHGDKGAAEAIAAARASGRHLHMYGIVQDTDYYEREVLPAVDGVKVTYHGAVGGTQRLRALGDARALLHLINFEEPFGLSVIEAMACGTPVIASRRGSMPELIEHGVTGFLVDSLDEANQAIERINEIDRRTVRRAVADRFTIDRMADAYLTLYRRIVGS